MITLFRIAIRNLVANTRRSLLLGGAIALVTVLLVVLSSVSNGMQANMLRVGTTLSSGHVNVAGFFKLTSSDASPMVTDYPRILKTLEDAGIKGKNIVVRGRGWGKVISDVATQMGVLVGIDVDKEKAFQDVVQVVSGDLSKMSEPNAVMLFEKQAKRLEVKVGDDVVLTAPTYRGVNNTVDCRVQVIAKDMGMTSGFSMFMNHNVLQKLYQMKPTHTGAIHIFLDDEKQADKVAAQARKALDKAGFTLMDPVPQPFFRKFQSVRREDWTGQRLDVTTWTDELEFMRKILQTFSLLTYVFIGVMLFIIIIGVMNTMMMAIRERTREIGTLRAMGMRRMWVLGMFVIEAGVLSFSSALAGSLLGAGVVSLLNAMEFKVNEAFQLFLMSDTLKLMLDVQTAVVAVAVIGTVTTLASVLPSWRAAKKPPVTAIQHV
ncbi:MAG: ABC transporter permease [Myxococcales bacterium]|nr:ABC transporter permease [Myxococcales bacterium]